MGKSYNELLMDYPKWHESHKCCKSQIILELLYTRDLEFEKIITQITCLTYGYDYTSSHNHNKVIKLNLIFLEFGSYNLMITKFIN